MTAAALGSARGIPAELRRRANAALIEGLPKGPLRSNEPPDPAPEGVMPAANR